MTQDRFDKLIKDYNDDFLHLLRRAGRKNYNGLLSSFKRLRDLYYAIIEFQDSGKYLFRILPYPLSFRANDDFLKEIGFDPAEMKNIYGFLEFVKTSQGEEFEEYIKIYVNGKREAPRIAGNKQRIEQSGAK
ncbi:MAG: hypothetical protein MPW13_11375 [Candidatus Manganitrophus sp.]|nr:hypothetical protein [Candidatus Manganitrophus sp.]